MKKYNAPSLEAFELEVTDTITASGAPHFVEQGSVTGGSGGGTGSTSSITPKAEYWPSGWDVD